MHNPLVLLLAAYLDEQSVITVTTSCASGLLELEQVREQSLARGLTRHLELLAAHTGADTSAEWQEQDRESDDDFVWRHCAKEWDLSD